MLARVALAAARAGLRGGISLVRNDVGRAIYLDKADPQAYRVLIRRGRLDRPAIALWRVLVRCLAPTVVLDVGCNYGEVVLSASYPPDCRVHCVEANGRVARYLARSLWHGLPRAELVVAAADRDAGHRFFVPSPSASGLGRVCDAPQPGGWQVASVRCDDLVRVGSADRLVFKIDVEGNEPRVLAGLSASMRTAAAAAGIVEFFHLDRAQKHELGAEHAVYAAGLDGTLLHRLDGSAIDAIFPAPGVVTPGYAKDVVLVTAGAQRLLDSVTAREPRRG